MRAIHLLIATLVLGGCSSSVHSSTAVTTAAPMGHSANEPMFQFIGSWQGTLGGYSAPHFEDGASSPLTVKIIIKPKRVAQVFTLASGKWEELKPNTFAVEHYGPHAIVVSTTSGKDSDGTWVETYVFTLASTSPGQLVAYALRTVNNLDMVPGHPHRQFAFGNSGVMHLIADGR